MKRISLLLKECMQMLACPLTARRLVDSKKMASEPEKEWVDCLKEKETKTPISAGQQKLLDHFIHFHSEN